MKNGSQPLRLLEILKRKRIRVLTRPTLLSISKGITHPDRAMDRLVREGLVDKVARGVWLIPSQQRPNFDIPRFWSNPDLSDPLTISALVVRNPTIRDITRMVVAYGTRPAEKAMAEMMADGDFSESSLERASKMISYARIGIANAAHRISA